MPPTEQALQPIPGSLVAIGVGPGDPELLTLKAVRLLKEADVVMTPVGDRSDASIARDIVAAHLAPRQEVLTRVFPMRQPADRVARAWRDIAAEVAGLVRSGKKVAFVTLGDPMLYSTFLYLRQELLTICPEVRVSTVPGVSSVHAAAGRAGVPLGLGDETVSIVPATAPDTVIRPALRSRGSVVLLKVYRNFARIKSLLQEAGCEQQAVYIRRLGLAGERVIVGLDRIDESDLDYLSLILVRSKETHG